MDFSMKHRTHVTCHFIFHCCWCSSSSSKKIKVLDLITVILAYHQNNMHTLAAVKKNTFYTHQLRSPLLHFRIQHLFSGQYVLGNYFAFINIYTLCKPKKKQNQKNIVQWKLNQLNSRVQKNTNKWASEQQQQQQQ